MKASSSAEGEGGGSGKMSNAQKAFNERMIVKMDNKTMKLLDYNKSILELIKF